jgi:hypothetical protein
MERPSGSEARPAAANGGRSSRLVAMVLNDPIPAALAVAIVLVMARVLLETRRSYFFSDDFFDDIIIHQLGLSGKLLKFDWLGEFIPLYGVAHWLYFHIFGLRFLPFRLLVAASQCATLALTAIYARRHRINPWVLIPVLGLMACSPIYSTLYQWYSASTQVMAGGLMSVAAIYAMAAPAALSPRRNAAATLLYMAGTLLFPKGVFVAIILASIRLHAAMSVSSLPLIAGVRRAAAEMVPVGLVGLGYAAAVYFGGYRSGVPLPGPDLLARYIWAGWNRGFLCSVFGLDRNSVLGLVAANAAAVALVSATIYRSGKVWVLWAGGLAYFLAAVATIAFNRAVPFGLESAATPRYYADMLPYFVAVTLFVLVAEPRRMAPTLSPAALCVVLALTGVGCVHLLHAASRVPRVWWADPLRVATWISNAEASVKKIGNTATIENGVAPDFIIASWAFPQSQYDNFLRMFPHHGVVVPPGQAQYRFDDFGHLVATKAH